jgi:hypothetical protein
MRLSERWDTAVAERWVVAGEPRPAVVDGPDGVPAFWIGGDSGYFSGGYSRQLISPRAGAGLETRLSTAITMAQWQLIVLEIGPARDEASLAHWDHTTDWEPAIRPLLHFDRSVPNPGACSVMYPARDGLSSMHMIKLKNDVLTRTFSVDPDFGSGSWYAVRVQVFADGRCGFALNGEPLWITESRLPLELPFRVALYGKSYHTRILAGPLDVWEGVRGDIDWSALEAPSEQAFRSVRR